MSRLRYPCTGHVDTNGFPEFLRSHLGAPRANLKAFAHELRDAFGAARVTLTNSGSSANFAAALALRERSGDRRHAIASAFTFPTTISALLLAGFEVTLADTEPGGFAVDPDAVRRALRPDTAVVAVTHFLGFPADLDALAPMTEASSACVLQDACETMDLRLHDGPVSRVGALTTWSFYHPHHLSAYGGGAVISNDEETQRALESLTHWGRACTCHVDDLPCVAPAGLDHQFHYLRAGQNLEMSELNACFGRFQLQTFGEQEKRRRARYDILFEALSDRADVWPRDEASPFVFPIALRKKKAADVATRLRARGVEARSLMGGVVADQPAYRGLANDGLANGRGLAARSFFVGIHQTLPEEDVRDVARILSEEVVR